jgi:hypothetical protein
MLAARKCEDGVEEISRKFSSRTSKAKNEAPAIPGPNLNLCSGHREMIFCVPPDPSDIGGLLDYSV